jgi:hypothetical protein
MYELPSPLPPKPRFTLRVCSACGLAYLPTGPAQRYCDTCGQVRRHEQNRQRAYEHAVKTGRIRLPGVGSGGAQTGQANHQWKGGASPQRLQAYRKSCCERCGSARFVVAHHRDRNRRNNTGSNCETLCRSCHASEHGLWRNLIQPGHT